MAPWKGDISDARQRCTLLPRRFWLDRSVSQGYTVVKALRHPALDHLKSDWRKSHADLPKHADAFLKPWSRFP